MDCRNCESSFRWERGASQGVAQGVAMDKHDKEFEAYLRQFRLRQPGPPPEIASASRRSSMGWLLVAAVVVLAVGISAVLVRNHGNGSGPKVTVEEAGSPSLYRVGETIEA